MAMIKPEIVGFLDLNRHQLGYLVDGSHNWPGFVVTDRHTEKERGDHNHNYNDDKY